MTEDQIERRVERWINVLDRAFMRGDIDQKTYDREIFEIDQWAKQQWQRQSALSRGR